MKRTISILICLMLVLSMAIPAFADEPTFTLTIENKADGHTYEAYQIFKGTLETAAGTGVQVLTNIVWGDSISDVAGLQAAIEAMASAAEDTSPLKKLMGSTGTAAALAEAIADNITTDSESLDALAAVFANYMDTPIKSSSDVGDAYEITDLPAGYYLVKDADGSLDEKYDSYTKFILRVLKDETVKPKSSVPTVDKTINDTIDGTFSDYEDFDISDTAYYKWTATMPSNIKDYESYHLKFYDTLPKGITFSEIKQIYIEGSDGNVVHVFYDITDTLDASDATDTMPTGITLSTPDAESVDLLIEDLVALYPNILPTHKVVVKYSAMVDRYALISEHGSVKPMTNEVYLEFSNDPNYEGGGDYGETPPDVAHAFTFGITVDKYDADNTDKKLEGAEFVLYYERIVDEVLTKYYAKVITEEMIAANELVNGVAVTADDLGVVYGWTTNEAEAAILDTDASGHLYVKGLDSGIYYLKETKAPAGYNLMETPVKVEIIAERDPATGEIKSVTHKVDDIAQSTDVVGVRNSSGSTLPSTGGMGTTLFYAFGSVLFIGAAVLLITKKRMSA